MCYIHNLGGYCMEYCKLQIGCLLVIAYIAFLYVRERRYEKSSVLRPSTDCWPWAS